MNDSRMFKKIGDRLGITPPDAHARFVFSIIGRVELLSAITGRDRDEIIEQVAELARTRLSTAQAMDRVEDEMRRKAYAEAEKEMSAMKKDEKTS